MQFKNIHLYIQMYCVMIEVAIESIKVELGKEPETEENKRGLI